MRRIRGRKYEVHNVYGHIVQALVVVRIKVSGYLTIWVVLGDLEEVCREAHFQLTLGLSDILDAASFASDAVNKVGAGAAHIISTHVCSARRGTQNTAICVKLWTIPTSVRA